MAFRSTDPVDIEDHNQEEDGNKDNMQNSKRASQMQVLATNLFTRKIEMTIMRLKNI